MNIQHECSPSAPSRALKLYRDDTVSEILSNLRIAKTQIAFTDFHETWVGSGQSVSCKFYAVLDGALCLSTKDRTTTHTICRHQIAFVLGNEYVVSNTTCDTYEPCHGIRAAFELSMGEMVVGPMLLPSILVSRPADPTVSQHVQLLVDEMGKPGHPVRPVITSMVMTLLLRTLGETVEGGDSSAILLQVAGDEHLGPVIALMHESPGDAWTLERLANESGLSRSSFAQRFQLAFGRPAFAYLRELRLSRGARLLKTTSMTISEISTEVGYSSESAFSSAFQDFHGEAPGRYRVEYRESGSSAAG